MTSEDVKRIFKVERHIRISNGIKVTINDFLNLAGFKDAPKNPTKEDLHKIDKGKKGYTELIESGNYD